MTQQEIYQKCIEYGACVEAFINVSIVDAKNGEGHDDCMAAIMIGIENELIKSGVEIDWMERAKEVRKRIEVALA